MNAAKMDLEALVSTDETELKALRAKLVEHEANLAKLGATTVQNEAEMAVMAKMADDHMARTANLTAEKASLSAALAEADDKVWIRWMWIHVANVDPCACLHPPPSTLTLHFHLHHRLGY